jgi:hypothetical protein
MSNVFTDLFGTFGRRESMNKKKVEEQVSDKWKMTSSAKIGKA